MMHQLKQHNAITEARYEMSALEKNILYMLMREITEEDHPEKEYVVDLLDIEKIVGDLSIQEIREATANLIRRAYKIRKENGNILTVSLMTVVRADYAEKKLRIKISRKILPYFVALKKNYTQFGLHVALSLRHKYSKRLYEMLSQHKEAGQFSISVKELKWRLGLIAEEGKTEKYMHFDALKKNVLEIARKELSRYADISFSYTATKTERKYTDLTFRIKPVGKEKFDQLMLPLTNGLCSNNMSSTYAITDTTSLPNEKSTTHHSALPAILCS